MDELKELLKDDHKVKVAGVDGPSSSLPCFRSGRVPRLNFRPTRLCLQLTASFEEST